MEMENLKKKIEDNNLRESFEILVSKKIIDVDPQIVLPKENSEVKEMVVDKVKSFLEDKKDDIASRISELRKRGLPVEVEWMKSLQLSLKIKVFLATYSKKDLANILNRFEELEKEIKSFS